MMLLTPHIWVMDLTSPDPKVPKCLYCCTSSVRAQYEQSETAGAGPCPIRFQEWLDKHIDGPDAP